MWVAKYSPDGELLWFQETPNLGWKELQKGLFEYRDQAILLEPDGSAIYIFVEAVVIDELAQGIGWVQRNVETDETREPYTNRGYFLKFNGDGQLVSHRVLPSARYHFSCPCSGCSNLEWRIDDVEGIIHYPLGYGDTALTGDGIYAILESTGSVKIAGDPAPTKELIYGKGGEPHERFGCGVLLKNNFNRHYLAKFSKDGATEWIKPFSELIETSQSPIYLFPEKITSDPEGDLYISGRGHEDFNSTVASHFFVGKFSPNMEPVDVLAYDNARGVEFTNLTFGKDGFLYATATKPWERFWALINSEEKGHWIGKWELEDDLLVNTWAVLHPLSTVSGDYEELKVTPQGDLFIQGRDVIGRFIVRYGNNNPA